MIFRAQVNSCDQIHWAKELGIEEVILCHNILSREGGSNKEELKKCIELSAEQNLKLIILADRLVEEDNFDKILAIVQEVKQPLRFRDPGLASKFVEKEIPFEFIIDNGNANLHAIKAWEELLSPALKCLVLNSEIPGYKLGSIVEQINTPTELLGFGPIAMYYTPRKLLQFQNIESKDIHVHSDELGAGKFHFSENDSGTVMYNNKELCLLNHLPTLEEIGVTKLRIDLRHFTEERFEIFKVAFCSHKFDQLKEKWPIPLLHGYFGQNRSDSVFHHLPKKRKLESALCLGEILDFEKPHYLARCHHSITLKDKIIAKNIHGELGNFNIRRIYDLEKNNIEELKKDEIGFIDGSPRLHKGAFLYAQNEAPK